MESCYATEPIRENEKAGGEQELFDFTRLIYVSQVVLKKQEKVSAKTGNKFAFLQVSDPAGVWEGMVFSETLARCRDCMNSGDHVLLNVDVDVKDEQLRFLVQDAKPLDDALASSVQQVRITIDERTDIDRLFNELKGCDVNGI